MNFENIKGVARNMYFVDHAQSEVSERFFYMSSVWLTVTLLKKHYFERVTKETCAKNKDVKMSRGIGALL